MAFAPIAFVIPEYDRNLYKNWWLKAYEPGTTTPKVMATDQTGSSTASRYELNTEGFPITAGNALVVPHVDGDYDLWLFPTAAEADANDTTNALQFADNLGIASLIQSVSNTSSDVVLSADTVADLKTKDLQPGQTISTKGYYTAGDPGGASYLIQTSAEFGGTPDELFSITLDNGNIAVIQSNGEINLNQIGIFGDGVTIHKLKPVADYMNTNNVDIIGEADQSTPILFDDPFVIENNTLYSNSQLALKYVGTPVTVQEPIIILGEDDFSQYGPARFNSTQQYRVGEVVEFDSGGYGDVLFLMGGFVYFHWHSDGGNAFPVAGATATGQSSGRVETVTSIRPRAFGPSNYNAKLKNVFLTTTLDLDGGGVPLSHVSASGIVVQGVREARWSGGLENVVVQGFWNGVVVMHSWFMGARGTITANRCIYGVLLSEEVNHVNLNSIVASACGTQYDTIKRYTTRISYSYAITAFIDNESSYRAAPNEICSCQGVNITGGDIESSTGTHAWQFQGSPVLSQVADPTDFESRLQYNRAITLHSARLFDSLCVAVGSYNEGLNLNYTASWNDGDPAANITNTLVFTGIGNKDISIKGINSPNFDFKSGFESAHTLSDAVVFSDDCYEFMEFTGDIYKPTAQSSINMGRAFDSVDINFELLDISVGNDKGNTTPMDAAIFDLDGSNYGAWNFTLTASTTAPNYGTFYNTTFGAGKYVSSNGLRMRFTNMRTDSDNNYNFTVRARRLSI